ncbi:hypothetical protein [Clostridium sp. FP1]|nr:hypothetical protein [Clostridium sp. FP1]MBZ9633028.1 hypothetical protein [Clostridium sp. FP1]MBZ9633153.1 hypothetical protein [Clostridium sp. FP1]
MSKAVNINEIAQELLGVLVKNKVTMNFYEDVLEALKEKVYSNTLIQKLH